MNSYRVLRTFKSDSKRDIQTLDYSPRVHNWIILLYLVCKSWLETMQDKNRILFSTFWILFIAMMQIIIIIRNLNYLAHLIRSILAWLYYPYDIWNIILLLCAFFHFAIHLEIRMLLSMHTLYHGLLHTSEYKSTFRFDFYLHL